MALFEINAMTVDAIRPGWLRILKNEGSLSFASSRSARKGSSRTTNGEQITGITITVRICQAILSAAVGNVEFHLGMFIKISLLGGNKLQEEMNRRPKGQRRKYPAT